MGSVAGFRSDSLQHVTDFVDYSPQYSQKDAANTVMLKLDQPVWEALFTFCSHFLQNAAENMLCNENIQHKITQLVL